jgi:hypothetical protein
MQEGEDDEDINTNDASTLTPVPIAGPLTRAHAHKLNHQVSSLLSSCPSCLDLGDACTLILIRNQGEDQKGKDSRRLDSDCSIAPTCDSHHGCIRSQIWVF